MQLFNFTFSKMDNSIVPKHFVEPLRLTSINAQSLNLGLQWN